MYVKRTINLLISVWIAIFIITGPESALAHPHVFADTSLDMVFDRKGLSGIRVRWVFDEFFSSMILGEFDKDHDNRINPKENKGLEQGAFQNLKNYNYFNWIAINGRQFDIKRVRDFRAQVEKGRLTYSFFIPCQVKASQSQNTVVVSPSDPTYYTALEFASREPATIRGGDKFLVEYKIAPSTERTIYYGMVYPLELTLSFKLKK